MVVEEQEQVGWAAGREPEACVCGERGGCIDKTSRPLCHAPSVSRLALFPAATEAPHSIPSPQEQTRTLCTVLNPIGH